MKDLGGQMTPENREGLLSPYRILDLTNERGFLCGKLLGDLGADVLKIEKPRGDPARSIGPFYHNIPDPEKSLYWWAFNINKRGITLDIETADGQEIFRRLVKSSDFVIESFDPGYMDSLNLGFDKLSQINPGIIMTSITGFGQTGPYKNYKAAEVTLWSLSGDGYVTGDPDRAPLMPSSPVGYSFAATAAAVGSVIAIYHRALTGEGQHVDSPAYLGLAWASGPEFQGLWSVDKTIVKRSGGVWSRPQTGTSGEDVKYIDLPLIYKCKDGYLRFMPFVEVGMLPSTMGLTKWVIDEGMASEALKKVDWSTWNWQTVSQETVDDITKSFSRFFIKYTKAELWEGAQKKGIQLYPLLTTSDMIDFEQLKVRGFWEEVDHPELHTTVTYPGAFVKMTGAPCRIRQRAPLIGEHNHEIYIEELGYSKEELTILKQAKVI